MSNDTNRTSVRIKPDDIIKMLRKSVMHFDGLDIVYNSLRFNDEGYMINLKKEYCETFLSPLQAKDIARLKIDADNVGIKLDVDVSTFLLSDASVEADEEWKSRDTWWYGEFEERFRKMADAIRFFKYHHTQQDSEDSDSKVRKSIKGFLAECVMHL